MTIAFGFESHLSRTLEYPNTDNDSNDNPEINPAGPRRFNRQPVFNPINPQSVNEEELLQFTINAVDPDGDNLTYTASTLPKGASFDSTTKTFAWKPELEQAGSYRVNFTVSDGELTDSQEVLIDVNMVDVEVGLSYFGARFYDPECGRFLTLDPKKDGANWFAYCQNNPLNRIDPDGCLTIGLGGSASAAFLGRIGLSGTVVIDDKGNIGIAVGGDIGAGFPNASAGGAAQVTTANNIFDLNGMSVNVGFIFSGGVEFIVTDTYIGINIAIKPATTPTPDAHAVLSGTKVYSLNWLPEAVQKEVRELIENGLRQVWNRLPDDVQDNIKKELGLPDDFMGEDTTESD